MYNQKVLPPGKTFWCLMPSETIRLPYPIPYYAQVASPELAGRIFDDHMDACLDPKWAETGAADPQEYAYWTARACGAACVQMALEALGAGKRSLLEVVRAGVERGGYLTETTPEGTRERGWKHQALADLLLEAGLEAYPASATLEEIAGFLKASRLVIASVSYELGTERPVSQKGGHLVLVTGMNLVDEQPGQVLVHNPSGRTPALQVYARIPAARFAQAFSGRVIVVAPKYSPFYDS